MSTGLIVKTSTGVTERNGLTIWDITKHAVATCLKALGPDDQATIIVFSDQAVSLSELEPMTPLNTRRLLVRLEAERPGGCTNLSGGIDLALRELKGRQNSSREATIMVFTDGLPNVSPTFGEFGELERYKQRNEGIPTIHTFGFGNRLDSGLLSDIALLTGGQFGFIPDGAFLATIFVNAVSNILSSYATNATLHTGADQIELGGLQYGQDRWISLPGTIAPNLLCSQGGKTLQVPDTEVPGEEFPATSIYTHSMVVRALRKCLLQCSGRMFEEAKETLDDVIKKVIQDSESRHPPSLLADLTGQAQEAITPMYFSQWGAHWLRSNVRAHELQVCNNFKDPGVQLYGGAMFHTLQDEINQVFNSLPAPVPSGRAEHGITAPRSLSVYNNSDNPCFAGHCLVLLGSGSSIPLRSLVKGDTVWTDSGPAKVRCVLRTRCQNDSAELVCFDNGLQVTPYHPINLPGKGWVHPCTVKKPVTVPCPEVYSVLLDRGHTMMVESTLVICLGHGRTEGILEHSFYGTQQVIDFLAGCSGWPSGLVDLGPGCVERNEEGEVVSLRVYE